MTTVAEIEEARSQLVASVRSFVKEQLETWRLVPYLALQADGRNSRMNEFAYALSGLWYLETNEADLHNVFIDCDTGDLIRLAVYREGKPVYRPVSGWEFILLSMHINKLDAAQVVASLRKKIEQPSPYWFTDEDIAKREAQLQRIQTEHRLQERFVRNRPLVLG